MENSIKKIALFIILALFIQSAVLSQPCLPDGITFTTQAEIDNFQTNNPNCTEIQGDVVIEEAVTGNITNLNGLSVLTSIGGSLKIGGNGALTSLTGLSNLTSIDGNLTIGWDLDPYGTFGNPALTSLTGLDNVTFIGGDLSVENNDALTSLTGLNNVTSIGGGISINWNYNLTSLIGLDNVASIGGNLWIDGNIALTSLTCLDNVTSIGGGLWIIDIDALTNLTGLDSVTSIGGNLMITDNDMLSSLNGLDNIGANSITDLFIANNSSLSTCEVQSICDYLATPSGTIFINDNATGCNSQDEVEEACTVSVDEVQLSDKLSIFPNPTSSQITIELPFAPQKNSFLTVHNINSRKLLTRHITEQKTVVDVSGLPNGFYFVKVADDKKVMVGKMVKR